LDALKTRHPGFLCFMSSAEALAGNAGWGFYGGSCAFQDAMAKGASRESEFPIRVMNWGYWEGNNRGNVETLLAKGVRPISVDSGMEAVSASLQGKETQVVVLDVALDSLRRMGFDSEDSETTTLPRNRSKLHSRSSGSNMLVDQPASEVGGPEGNEATMNKTRPLSNASGTAALAESGSDQADHKDPRTAASNVDEVQAVLAVFLAKTLGIRVEDIDPQADIAEYGVDSILFLDFVELIEKQFGHVPVDELIALDTLREISVRVTALNGAIVVSPAESGARPGGADRAIASLAEPAPSPRRISELLGQRKERVRKSDSGSESALSPVAATSVTSRQVTRSTAMPSEFQVRGREFDGSAVAPPAATSLFASRPTSVATSSHSVSQRHEREFDGSAVAPPAFATSHFAVDHAQTFSASRAPSTWHTVGVGDGRNGMPQSPRIESDVLLATAPLSDIARVLLDYPAQFNGSADFERPDPNTLQQGCFRHQLVQTASSNVEVLSCGSGPAVLFIPGIGLTAPVFHAQFEALCHAFTVIVIHLPGHGRSSPPKSATTESLAETIESALRRLGTGPVHIVASCFSTVVGQYLAARRPDLVASLTLCGAASEGVAVPTIPPGGLSKKDVARLREEASNSLVADFEALARAGQNAHIREHIEESCRLLLSSQKASPAVGMKYLNEVLGLRPSEWTPDIIAPILFIIGTLDTVVSQEAMIRTAAKFRGARIVEFASAGHYPFLTHPAQFNAALAEFLRSAKR
jgi:pimeloyl-ACP methyl ester carboxylesterase/acyl carrier protein